MTVRRISLILAACLLSLAAAGCADSRPETRTIENMKGQSITVPVEAKRIAAVYGPSYETLVMLGAEERIVACSDVQVDNFPWAQRIFKRMISLPKLENVHTAVNIEALLSYKPDLVLGFPRPNESNKLDKLKIANVPGAVTPNLESSLKQLEVYAAALGGDAPERAREYEDYFHAKLKRIKDVTDKLDDSERPAVYYSAIDLLSTYGKYSDLTEVISAAGGRSVTADFEAGNHSQITFEQLVQYNPAYIFIDHGGLDDLETTEKIRQNTYSDGRYGLIEAVANKRVYLTPSGVFYWDMGLQKILLVMEMAKILHPDRFGDLDMNAELREFYSKFYHYELTAEEAGKILNRENP
ncbi:ABC transporter substrate-binding protein [Paenibacillus durus]|uniref:ABC transporter substrate-binding protein n=1 Tax=Paenibacillus durus TaxID=44251 RepID=UPI0006944FA4|nr:ABC transporter substrate-binding protein [Paenibacillus durus]